MAAWHDLATAVAAWLLHRLGALTAEELPGLAGAKRWESTALNAVAAHRLDQHQNAAALPLLLDAISLDPGNLAAQYGRLALEARQINGAAPDAGRRYWNTYEALVALSLKGPAPKTLQWRCTYNIGVLLINGARAPRSVGLPMGSERAAEEAAKQLGELITKLRCETDEKTGPLAKELIDLSRTACLGAALLARAYGDVVRTAVREATACTRKSPSDNKACDQGSRADLATPEQVCQHIDRWLDPKELDLLASRVSYNAACTRALLDEDKIKQGQVPPKLEAFLRRAFQERQLAKNAGYDPFLKELRELSWFRSLQEEAGAKPKPIGLAAFAAVSGHIKRLADADICTLEELRARLGRDDERQRLASMLGLPQQQLLTWRAMLELWALPGKDEPPIPIETINLLAAVGISSIAELSTQRSRVLRERLNAARYALGADAALPEEAELKTWIDHAKLRGSPIRSSAS